MKENPISIKTKKQNMLKTKVSPFKSFYKESQQRMNQKSLLTNLAGKFYSTAYNKQFKEFATQRKSTSKLNRPFSAKKQNPQKQKLQSLKGLQMRVTHTISYAQINTNLLQQKKNLQNFIKTLKQRIAQQKKKLNNADYNAIKNRNTRDKETEAYQLAHEKSQRLEKSICEVKQQRDDLNNQNLLLSKKIQITKNNIERQEKQINDIDEMVRKLKHELMHEQKQRLIAKNELGKELRVMSAASIYNKQLQNQRANVLLEINKFVKQSKI